MPGLYAGRQEVVASSQQALRRTSEPADRHTYSACNLKKGIVPPVAWLRVKDGVLRSHFALRMSSQINRSLSTELFCSKSIRSNMTLSLISLLYKDIAELWLLLKKCTGVSLVFQIFLVAWLQVRQELCQITLSCWGKWDVFYYKGESCILLVCIHV